jgi:CelD/BcsL family acetyltransferase involved in cellulose biosynthesis
MKIDIIDNENDFDRLEAVWNELADQTPSSFFSSFDYVRTAWHHFHGNKDRLFILVLSEADTILSIAPFYITQRRRWGIPCRIIKFISSWEGDRPRILVANNDRDSWIAILNYLQKDFTKWEILDLMEQPVEGPASSGWSFLPQSGLYWESEPDGVNHFISLKGSWDDYLSGLSSKTRSNWRRQTRRISTAHDGYTVERITDPAKVGEALDRFITLEQASWKAESKVGIAKDQHHQRFYINLINLLARKKQVMFIFLKIGEEDTAGSISFILNDIVYGRHTAYLPARAEYSPGILLLADVIREGFLMPWRELDMLGLEEGNKSNKYKVNWANGKRKTLRKTAYRVSGRLLPVITGKLLKCLFTRQYRYPAKGAEASATIARDLSND